MFLWYFVLLCVLISGLQSYRVHQMRICIQSVDPTRLPSQCVYCKTRLFPITVRLCTANTYLPARMNLNEAFCLTTACRRQLPRMPAEPYPSAGSSIPINTALAGGGGGLLGNTNSNNFAGANSDESNFNSVANGGSGNGEPNNGDGESYEEAESLVAQQPAKMRPPAKFFLGKPQKYQNPNKLRPLLFG